MSAALVSLPLVVLVAVISTALYTVVPGAAYAVMLACLAALLMDARFVKRPFEFVHTKEVLGFLAFNVLFMLYSLPISMEGRTYFIHVLSLGSFLLTLGVTRRFLLDCEARSELLNRLSSFLVVALLVLLAGQAAEMLGYLDRRELGTDVGEISAVLRPGGFLNPNMTAAIALVFLFTVMRLRAPLSGLAVVAATIAVIVVALSQSRAALLFLALWMLMAITRRTATRLFFWGAAFVLVVLVVGPPERMSEGALQLTGSVIERIGGDASVDDRLYLLRVGLSAFADEPLWGHGYRHVAEVAGLSSHNEIVEGLVTYGIVGFAALFTCFALLYLPASWSFAVVCFGPTLMFSHNFFETVAFQASIGVALAVDGFAKRRAAHV